MTTSAHYATYRPSENRWLGDIPAHWGTPAIRHLARIRNGSDYKHVETHDEIGFPVIGSGGPFANSTEFMYDRETVLLGRKGTIDRPLYWDGPFWAVDTMFYTEIGPDLDPKFFYYFATHIDFGFYSTNTALPSMSGSDIRAIRVPHPPLDEQLQIAEYLDRETGKIDELMTKQEQLVATLTERRQSVITEGVLRGLDSSAELKASGMDAIGPIPVHWRVGPLKHAVLGVEQGVSPEASAELADSASWGVLKAGCVNGGTFSDIEHKRLPDDFDFPPSLAVAFGDLLVCRASGSPSLVGSAAIVKILRYHLILSDKTFRLRPKIGIDVRFIEQFMQSKAYREQVRGAISGAAGLANNLPMSALKSFQIAIPSLEEQVEIVDFLDQKIGQIDFLAAKAKEVILVLRERRAALISAAVTGKIDVRGL